MELWTLTTTKRKSTTANIGLAKAGRNVQNSMTCPEIG